jgi:hypothetical protein
LLHTCYYEMALAIKTNVSSITRYIIRFSSFVASISRLVEWSRCSTSLRNGFIISSQVGLASPCHTFCHPSSMTYVYFERFSVATRWRWKRRIQFSTDHLGWANKVSGVELLYFGVYFSYDAFVSDGKSALLSFPNTYIWLDGAHPWQLRQIVSYT